MCYESGNKCGQMLAKSVRDQKLATYIPYISSTNGKKAVLAKQIALEFRDFYPAPNNLPIPSPSQTQLENYLTSSQILWVSSELREELEAPITLKELQLAVGATKPDKAPGPDGFTLQYYKQFLPTLGPCLFNALGSQTALPRETLRAHVSVIPKDGMNPASCGSYRPISLLNLDLKLFTKMLVSCLQHHLQQLTNLDQVGFIPPREAHDNTVKVLNLIHIVKLKLPVFS